MKAALGALEQLNAIAWQHADASDHVTFPQQRTGGQHASMRQSKSMEKLKRSLSMPDQITRDIARPLLASTFEEVPSAFLADSTPVISNDIAAMHRMHEHPKFWPQLIPEAELQLFQKACTAISTSSNHKVSLWTGLCRRF